MKNKLAINGGQKTIKNEKEHYTWPNITEKTEKAVYNQLNKEISIYTRSGIIEEFETSLSSYFKINHCLLTNSGTSALHSMFVGANIQKDDEIICPVYTHFATVTPLFQIGAIPILVDCDESGNIDVNEIEKNITPKTKGVVVTHMWGIPCNMDTILIIAKKHNLMVFEDASHAVGATYKQKKVGTFGYSSAFSLQAKKAVTGGEGGVFLTKNTNAYYRALLLGQPRRSEVEIPKNHSLHEYTLTGMGLKYRIHPLAAVIANEQFNNLENLLAGRRRVAKILKKGLGQLPGIKFPIIQKNVEPSWYSFVIQYESSELGGLSISKFNDALKAEGCKEASRNIFTPPLTHFQLFQNPGKLFHEYSGKFAYAKESFPNAEKFYNNAIKLPGWYNPKNEFINLYIKAFKKVVDNYKELL